MRLARRIGASPAVPAIAMRAPQTGDEARDAEFRRDGRRQRAEGEERSRAAPHNDGEDIRDPGQDRHDEECRSLHVRDHIREDRDAAQDLDAFRKDGGRNDDRNDGDENIRHAFEDLRHI